MKISARWLLAGLFLSNFQLLAADLVEQPPQVSEKDVLKKKHLEARRKVIATAAKLEKAESQLRSCENAHEIFVNKGQVDAQTLARLASTREQVWDLKFAEVAARAEEEKAAVATLLEDKAKVNLLWKDIDTWQMEQIQAVANELVGDVDRTLRDVQSQQSSAMQNYQSKQESRKRMAEEVARQQTTTQETTRGGSSQLQADEQARRKVALGQIQKQLADATAEEQKAKSLSDSMNSVITQLKTRQDQIRKRAAAAGKKDGAITQRNRPTTVDGGKLDEARAEIEELRLKAEVESQALLEAERKQRVEGARTKEAANATTYVMKDGSKHVAAKVIDGGDVLAIKTPEGKMLTIKKSEIDKTIAPETPTE
jgi:hypothetical protein